MATRQTAALMHGDRSWGARYLRPGFARTPEMDLLVALGYPHLRYLVSGHPDEALSGEALEEVILKSSGLDIPAAHAARRVRTQAAFMCGPDGKWRPNVYKAFADDTPFTAKSAHAFIKSYLGKQESMGNQRELVLALEALVGADVVLGAVTEVFEAMSVKALREHDTHLAGWAWLAGSVLLLRTSRACGEALRPRLEAVVARSVGNSNAASVVAKLDHALHGHRADPSSREADFYMLPYYSDTPRETLLALLAETEIDKYCFVAEPRLVLLGGDAVLDLYRERWTLIKDGADQRELVTLFGEIRSPKIRPLMQELAAKSKAKKLAQAWLEAHTDDDDGQETPAPTPQASALPPLDADEILARLDAAVRDNDWPDFFELDPEDVFHGLRVVGVRSETGWGVVFERLQGDTPDSLVLRTYCYGSAAANGLSDDHPVSISTDDDDDDDWFAGKSQQIDGLVITGPRGALTLAQRMVKAHGLASCKQTGCPRFATIVRAYHAEFDGGGWWPDAERSATLVGLEAPRVILASDAFCHVALAGGKKKQPLPSKSKTYQSLAAALASGDGKRFKPGASNVGWPR